MKALILAAGYATRLYPLTRDFPKPLLKVGKKAIIDYIAEKIDKLDAVDEIIVITNDKFFPQFEKWAQALSSPKKIKVLNDLTKSVDDRRGAIGDISFAIDKEAIADDILVIAGDNLFDLDLGGFIRFAQNKKAFSIGIYDINDRDAAKKYGVVKVDKENKIIDFQEKPEAPESSLVATCLYYFPQEKLGLIREYLKAKGNQKDATGFYIDWLSKRDSVYGFLFTGHWYDIGHHDFYNQAKKLFS